MKYSEGVAQSATRSGAKSTGRVSGSAGKQAGAVRKYYSLTKPGVMYGNLLTAIAGFLLAASYSRHFDFGLFVAAAAGLALIISAACALNNYLDRDIDGQMERTKNRASVTGAVSPLGNIVFAIVLLILSLIILALWTNWLATLIGLAGFIVYVWLYGALSKRRSMHGTLVGSISGAMPILAGYCAVANKIDAGAILVFLILFFWQFPEFYSIAIYRKNEYKAAGVPVVSIVKGVAKTKRYILIYTIAYVVSTLLLTIFGYTGWIYFVVMLILGLHWIKLGLEGQRAADNNAWARKMFRFSMTTILALCVMLAIGPLLP